MWSFAVEYRLSLKNPETEDKVDLLLYRPLGFLSAKLAHWSGLSPTQVTLLGLLSGVSAGFLFAYPSPANFPIAAALFLLSGVLDSADGQLARISGRSSPLGLVLDGLCDNLVFGAVYLGCCTALASDRGPWVWPLAIAALVLLAAATRVSAPFLAAPRMLSHYAYAAGVWILAMALWFKAFLQFTWPRGQLLGSALGDQNLHKSAALRR